VHRQEHVVLQNGAELQQDGAREVAQAASRTVRGDRLLPG
jgi:hypothetical protein